MATGESTDFFTVSEQEADLRLDKLLSVHFPHYSRTYFQSLIADNCVLVNGERCKKRETLRVGDEIEVLFSLPPELSLEAEEIPLDILYEDEHLLAVNKPQGMVVHPAPGHPKGTFVNALLFHCRALESLDPLRPGIVHRLDKDTSGVLLAAKTAEAHRALVHQFAERKIQKTYCAICVGTPKEGLIDLPIRRHPIHRQQMSICFEKGKPAKSAIRVLQHAKGYSLLEIDLITGRTHQIRVHLKHLGTPIVGDPVYGSQSINKKFELTQQLLHAHRIQFLHPFQKNPIEIEAPLPETLKLFLETL